MFDKYAIIGLVLLGALAAWSQLNDWFKLAARWEAEEKREAEKSASLTTGS